MPDTNLTGRWIGHYLQNGKEYPITADFVEADDHLTGSMSDGHPDRESSVFEAAAAAGLPPGADEQIEARLRQIVPESGFAPIRHVSHLPTHSLLDGRKARRTVSFLKTYQGTSYGGYRVGDKLIGAEREAHSVHYQGQLSSDGLEIDGRWWIDANPVDGVPRTEGWFSLHRLENVEKPRDSPELLEESS
jgi:hypothetical protein